MQDVNQLMQSKGVRLTSRKRKSNTQNDADKAQKINATEVPTTRKCCNSGEKSHFTNQCIDPR
jgi:hypothetical protein